MIILQKYRYFSLFNAKTYIPNIWNRTGSFGEFQGFFGNWLGQEKVVCYLLRLRLMEDSDWTEIWIIKRG